MGCLKHWFFHSLKNYRNDQLFGISMAFNFVFLRHTTYFWGCPKNVEFSFAHMSLYFELHCKIIPPYYEIVSWLMIEGKYYW